MDNLEKFEESYAIAEEFREWIVNMGHDNKDLKNYVMSFPKNLNNLLDKKIREKK